jgi:serine/threonine protein phosphatase 1
MTKEKITHKQTLPKKSFVIADIHGCATTLSLLLDKILDSTEKCNVIPRFVFTGDYFDRGPHSKQVIDILLKLKSKYECIFIRGNHDDVICNLVDIKSYLDPKEFTNSPVHMWFAQHGLIPTLKSYGITDNEMNEIWYTNSSPIEVEDIYPYDTNPIGQLLRSKMPQTHIDFLENMQLLHVDTNFFCAHAWYPATKIPRDSKFLKNSDIYNVLWGRLRKENIDKEEVGSEWGSFGIFGHTPTAYYNGNFEPILRKNFLLLDTGSCFTHPEGSSITAFCVEDSTFISQATSEKDK